MDENLDTFEIRPDATDETTEIFQRLREFAYYLSENFENNLNFWLKVLEQRSLPKKPNSKSITVLSTLLAAVPTVGKGIGALLNQGELFVGDKIDKRNAQNLAKLIYYFSDNKQVFRRQLIDISIEIFYCYEKQFLRLTCDQGAKRAMQKLAIDTTNRILNYLIDNHEMIGSDGVSKDDLIKAVIYGKSMKNSIGMEKGRTLKSRDDQKWITSKIYNKTGLYCEETNEFYYNERSKVEKYGYRRQFSWETLENIRENWMVVENSINDENLINYQLNRDKFNELSDEINEYIMTKNSDEDAKLDRQKKHEESLQDQNEKYEEIVGKIQLILNYNQDFNEQNAKEHEIIANQLTKIHANLITTKTEIIESTSRIEEDVTIIKTKQEEIDNNVAILTTIQQQQQQLPQPQISLSDLIKDNYEVKKIDKALRRAHEDVEKTLKKAERDVKKVFKIRF